MISTLRDIAESRGLDAVLISAPDNIEYFTGIPSIGDSPIILAYDKARGGFSIYVPLLEYYRYRDLAPEHVEVYAVSKTLKPPGIPLIDMDWRDIIAGFRARGKIGADASHVSPLADTLKAALGERLVDISNDIWKLRMVKSNAELNFIKGAISVTLKAILAVYSELREGVTESTLAGVFEKAAREHGAERLAFEPIIAFKPNNSYPHTLPGRKALGKRDLVLIDVGVKVGGRCSDITRMIAWGRVASSERNAIEAVIQALEAAVDAIRPGAKAGEVHEAASKVLEKHGLLHNLVHGLGHGIGVSVHEPPYLRPHNDVTLEPGMVITVEPGVYFPGKCGVRVEEVVLVTKRGARVLSEKLEEVLRPL